MNSKICSTCKKDLPLDAFARDKHTKTGLAYSCRDCRNQQSYEWSRNNRAKKNAIQKAWRDKNPGWHKKYDYPETRRNNMYQNKYGLTSEQVDAMRLEQDYKCAICGISEEELGKILRVDHCHSTKEVRAMLCDQCNHGLGNFCDDVETMIAAIQYLNKYKGVLATHGDIRTTK